MKPMILALVATFVIAAGANFVLKSLDMSTGNSTSSSAVRPG